MVYIFLVLELMKLFHSFSTGHETLHLLHLKDIYLTLNFRCLLTKFWLFLSLSYNNHYLNLCNIFKVWLWVYFPNKTLLMDVTAQSSNSAVTHSLSLLGSKNVRKGGPLLFLISMGPCCLTIFDTSNIERARVFPSLFHGQSIHSCSAWNICALAYWLL